MSTRYRAFVIDRQDDRITREVVLRETSDLPEGEVTIRVAWSSVNYKDGLATLPKGGVARRYPLVPGIDLAGTVTESRDPRFAEGDEVLVTGFETGVAHDGGFAELARVKADWVVKRPAGLSAEEAMAFGTAGFTAALSVRRLEENGLTPDQGPVLVTGATGGVGSHAVAMLAGLGYEVHAGTGKADAADYLKSLGAAAIVDRQTLATAGKPVDSQLWAAVVDPVGGATLARALSTTRYGGSVAVSGLTGGVKVDTTVLPFILRGVNLLGIDSVYCPMAPRVALWDRMAGDLKHAHLTGALVHKIGLSGLDEALARILAGGMTGRALLDLSAD